MHLRTSGCNVDSRRRAREGASAIALGNGASSELVDAAAHGDVSAISRLLDAGADANSRDEEGATALMRAAQNGQFEAVGALLARGLIQTLPTARARRR
jgi:uncharacterized protein